MCIRRRPRTAWAPSAESCSWRTWPAICAVVLAVGSPIGGELDALEARAETAGRDPGRLHRQPQNRQGGAKGPGVPAALALYRPGRPAWLRPNADGGRRPRVAPTTLTDWPMAVQGPALVSVTAARHRAFYPVWLMFLQHRMRCVSTIRWRASLTILAGVVLIAAEGRAS